MDRPGIIGTLQLAAVFVFAVPAALFGVERAMRGDLLLGGTFIALAAALVVLSQRLPNPFDPADIAEAAADRTVGRLAAEEDADNRDR